MVSISLVKRKYRADGKEATTKDWYAQIRFTNPRASYLRSTGTADKRKAGEAARRLAREIEENELPHRGKPVWTLEGMFAKWITEYGHTLRSKKDIRWQIPLIIDVMGGDTQIKDITNKTVHGFVQGAKDIGKSGTIINRCLTRLRATMLYAGKKWDAPISPKIDWTTHFQSEPKEREVYLSPEDARAMMDKLPYHVALAMAFSLYTGMRLNELETLDWSMIDFDRGLARVNTKGGGTRGVWLSKKAVGILDAIGIKSAGQVFDLTNRRKHWEAARRTMGRVDLHWHDLRAMTATWARKYAGRDLRLIGQALGHSDTKVTERYARVVDREIATMMDDLPDLGMPKLTMQTSADLMQTSLANTDGRRS